MPQAQISDRAAVAGEIEIQLFQPHELRAAVAGEVPADVSYGGVAVGDEGEFHTCGKFPAQDFVAVHHRHHVRDLLVRDHPPVGFREYLPRQRRQRFQLFGIGDLADADIIIGHFHALRSGFWAVVPITYRRLRHFSRRSPGSSPGNVGERLRHLTDRRMKSAMSRAIWTRAPIRPCLLG